MWKLLLFASFWGCGGISPGSESRSCPDVVVVRGGEQIPRCVLQARELERLEIGPSGRGLQVSFPQLVRVRGDVRVHNNWGARAAEFPKLVQVDGELYLTENFSMVTLSFPVLRAVKRLSVIGGSEMRLIEFPQLSNFEEVTWKTPCGEEQAPILRLSQSLRKKAAQAGFLCDSLR